MSDLAVTIIIILCTGGLVFMIFFFTSSKKRRSENELKEYCSSHGYTYSRKDENLRKEIIIEGDMFLLTSKLTMSPDFSEFDSQAHHQKTVWSTDKGNGTWPTFALGSVLIDGNWADFPDSIKNGAIEMLMSETGQNLDTTNVRQVDSLDGKTYLLFEQVPGEGHNVIQKIKPFLNDWPKTSILFINCCPGKIYIQITDYFVKNIKLLEKVLHLGTALREL